MSGKGTCKVETCTSHSTVWLMGGPCRLVIGNLYVALVWCFVLTFFVRIYATAAHDRFSIAAVHKLRNVFTDMYIGSYSKLWFFARPQQFKMIMPMRTHHWDCSKCWCINDAKLHAIDLSYLHTRTCTNLNFFYSWFDELGFRNLYFTTKCTYILLCSLALCFTVRFIIWYLKHLYM